MVNKKGSMEPINGKFAGIPANKINLDSVSHYPKVWHMPSWGSNDDAKRIAVLREISMRGGRDPRIATIAVNILKSASVPPRSYKKQAQALLKWVQTNIYYINEPSERLQDPAYTLKVGYGDCDDMAILLASLFEACRLEWRFVLSGKVKGKTTRWIEGTPLPKNGKWAHIYLMVGYPPFQPKKWFFAEPTLSHVDLGWDIISAMKRGENPFPEMGATPELQTIDLSHKTLARAILDEMEKRRKIKPFFQQLKTKLHPRNIAIAVIGAIIVSRVVKAVNQSLKK